MGFSTVEGCLESALQTVLGSAPALRVAGRTDAGVHARRQVVSLRLPGGTDLPKLAASLNALTPAGIAVTRIVRAPEGFDARKDAMSRGYRYFLSTAKVVSPFWSRYCWLSGTTSTEHLLDAAAEATVGHHDFTAFTRAVTEHSSLSPHGEPVRVAPGARREPGLLRLEIEADCLLAAHGQDPGGYHGRSGRGQAGAGGATAACWVARPRSCRHHSSAHGLFLWDVKYGEAKHRRRAGRAGRRGRRGRSVITFERTYPRYHGHVIKPYNEADSLVIQVMYACAHGKCIFCGSYMGKSFRLRPLEYIREDIYGVEAGIKENVTRVFLSDGDVLTLPLIRMVDILDTLKAQLPGLQRVSAYATPHSLLPLSVDELREMREHGLELLYVGLESGDDVTLALSGRGLSAAQQVRALRQGQTGGHGCWR